MRVTMISAAVGLMILAGCDGSTEPAQPPTQEDALTTATVAPTTSDEVQATTEAAPTTTEPTEESASGAQDSIEGAQVAVETYIATLAKVHADGGSIDELRELASPECTTCAAFVDAAEKERFGHEYMRYIGSEATLTGDQAIVHTEVEQVTDGASIDLVFTLELEGEQWLVSEIQVSGN